MSLMLEKLFEYFQFAFVRNAFLVGILIALSSSFLGVTLVLKRFSFIGDGLSHVAFGAIAIASAFSLTNNFTIALPITIVSAVLLLQTGQNSKIKGDAAIAMISVGALAIGYLVMNLSSSSSNLAGDVCTTLFGSTKILTLSMTEVWLSTVLSLLVVVYYIIFYNKIFCITFDEDFATAIGLRTKIYNLILAIVLAVVIVMAMNLVGALLISALVIFPALSSMRVFTSFKAVTISSVLFSVACAIIGIIVSILVGTPVGPTIVAINIMGFVSYSLIGFCLRRIHK